MAVHRGGTQVFDLELANSGDSALRGSVASIGLIQNDDGRPVPTPKAARDCSTWITFSPTQFPLPAHGYAKVKCTVRAPISAVGAYYAFASVYLTPTEAAPAGAGSIGQLLNSVVMVVVMGPDQLQAKLRVEAIGMSAPAGQPWQGTVKVSNGGNMHAKIKVRGTLATLAGTVIEKSEAELGPGFVLAGCARTARLDGKLALVDGVYQLRTEVDVEGQGQPMLETARFTVEGGKVAAATGGATVANAAPLLLQPAQLGFDLPPRGRRMQSLTVINMTDQPQAIEPRVLGWNLDEKGNTVFPDAPAGRDVGAGLTVTPASLTIAPHGRGTVVVSCALPPGAQGEYFGAVYLAPAGSPTATDAFTLGPRTALVTAVATGTAQPLATVPQVTVTSLPAGGYEVKVTVANSGNCRCPAQGQVEMIHGAATVDRLPFGGADTVVLPGGQRTFTITWPRVLDPGGYRAVATENYAADHQAKGEAAFTVAAPPAPPAASPQPAAAASAPPPAATGPVKDHK
jgi:hypothetical protein